MGGRSHGFFFFLGGGAFVVNRVLEGDSTNFVNLTANQGGGGAGGVFRSSRRRIMIGL